ncbi:MAG: double zinc ribbon domain-containing protein [Ignavibacteriales bacterium]|nr:double zinc ribbon domain-containing protein [Ignavibacteriales bacterium]
MKIRDLTNRLTSPFLDFLYPPVCVACNKPLPDGGQKVCMDCWNAIPLVTQHLHLYQETRAKLRSGGDINDLVSCFVFEKEGSFQHIAHALKYKEYKSIGIDLGIRIGETLEEWNFEVDLLIPVPLHRIKQRERGYNQSEFIARGISSVIGKPIVLNAVCRTRHTLTQTKLTIEERRKNMEHAFELSPHSSDILFEQKCLLVDDVITTGATTNSCAQVMHLAGAAKIIAAAAALAE